MKVCVKKLNQKAVIPVHMHKGDAAVDLCACIGDTYFIGPRETRTIPTGLAVAIPEGYFGALFARSGVSVKQGLRPANCVGVINANYRGEILIALHNDSEAIRIVRPGDRVAQLAIIPCSEIEFDEVAELDDTVRGEDDFGSTGV